MSVSQVDDFRSHIVTTDHTGRQFVIIFLMSREDDYNNIFTGMREHVGVMRGFATAWNRGDRVSTSKWKCITSRYI